MKNSQLLCIAVVVFAFSAKAFSNTQPVKNIECIDQTYAAKGEVPGLVISIDLSEAINPVNNSKIYGLKSDIKLSFRSDVAHNQGIDSEISRDEVLTSKEPAMYSHELKAMWREPGSNLSNNLAKLSLVPVIDDSKTFTGEWMASFYYPAGEFGVEISGYVIDRDTLEETKTPKLLCQRAD